jgi:hypothetical protein
MVNKHIATRIAQDKENEKNKQKPIEKTLQKRQKDNINTSLKRHQ